MYYCHNHKGIKLLTRLHLDSSHLRKHKFKHRFQDCLNHLYLCSNEIKTYTQPSKLLNHPWSSHPRSSHQFSTKSKQLLLYKNDKSLNQLKLPAKCIGINDYKNKSEDELIKVFSEPRPKITFSKKRIKKIWKKLKELRDFLCQK